MPLKTFDCPFCKKPMRGEDLARNTIAFSSAMHLHVTTCPHCGKNMEYRAASGALDDAGISRMDWLVQGVAGRVPAAR